MSPIQEKNYMAFWDEENAALHGPDRVQCFYPVHQFKKLVLLTSKSHLISNSHIIKQLMRMLL